MPLPTIPDTMRVAVILKMANGHRGSNVLHFRKTGVLTFPGAITLLDPILLNLYTVNQGAGLAWKSIAPANASIVQFEYTPLDNASATTVIAHNVAGIDANDPLPAGTALVVTVRTALRGRAHRGRVYTGPYCEDANTAGAPTAPTVLAVQTQWQWLISTGLTGTGVSFGVASYKNETFENATSLTVDPRWDTQRRRLNV